MGEPKAGPNISFKYWRVWIWICRQQVKKNQRFLTWILVCFVFFFPNRIRNRYFLLIKLLLLLLWVCRSRYPFDIREVTFPFCILITIINWQLQLIPLSLSLILPWFSKMFKNTFQSGFLSILYSIGSKPLQIWDKKVIPWFKGG